jgi:hypothetical protein
MDITNKKIFTDGELQDSYPCDVDPETGNYKTNGCIENLYEYNGIEYYIFTTFDGKLL